MRMNENKSTPGKQSLQLDETVWRAQNRTYAHKEHAFRRINSIPIKPLRYLLPIPAQHLRPRIYRSRDSKPLLPSDERGGEEKV
jgi:hypothetical protein